MPPAGAQSPGENWGVGGGAKKPQPAELKPHPEAPALCFLSPPSNLKTPIFTFNAACCLCIDETLVPFPPLIKRKGQSGLRKRLPRLRPGQRNRRWENGDDYFFGAFVRKPGADERIEGSVMTSDLDLCSSGLEGSHRIDFPFVSYLNQVLSQYTASA